MDLKLYGTINRKMIHLFALPIWFILVNVDVSVISTLAIMIVLATIINAILLLYSIRTKRTGQVNFGLTMTFSIVISLFFRKYLLPFTMVMLILILADGFSTIVPLALKDKTHKINKDINNKTYEGSITFYIITLVILLIFTRSIQFSILLSLFLTVIEYFSDNKILKVDDNILIWLCASVMLI
jgi:dolichol kinase